MEKGFSLLKTLKNSKAYINMINPIKNKVSERIVNKQSKNSHLNKTLFLAPFNLTNRSTFQIINFSIKKILKGFLIQ